MSARQFQRTIKLFLGAFLGLAPAPADAGGSDGICCPTDGREYFYARVEAYGDTTGQQDGSALTRLLSGTNLAGTKSRDAQAAYDIAAREMAGGRVAEYCRSPRGFKRIKVWTRVYGCPRRGRLCSERGPEVISLDTWYDCAKVPVHGSGE